MAKASTNDEQDSVSNLPKHEQARLYVEKIAAREAGSRPFNPIRASGVFLQSVNADVSSLTERINLYAERLELQDGLTPKDCFAEVKTVTLDQFFTDTEGMYIPLSEFDIFLHSCQRLFAVIERGLERKDRNVEYSVRLMNKCFTSIHNVCRAVEEASR
ncbi:hypothetical protein [Ralstonia phage RP31]|uniref:Uncharacterized protein n=1 Tax=Ralstonia phage RP31 TaxID=1923890 RepID=A0A1L7N1E7_9CAUD|nr:hypothetical protein [Ralstonia phage RP31]